MTKIALTERRNPDTVNIDLMDSLEIARTINNEDKKVALAVEKTLPQIGQAIELIAEAFLKGGRLAYFGAGTSGRLGVLDASECWPTFGVEHGMVCGFIAGGDNALRFSVENSEDSAELGLADLKTFNPTPAPPHAAPDAPILSDSQMKTRTPAHNPDWRTSILIKRTTMTLSSAFRPTAAPATY